MESDTGKGRGSVKWNKRLASESDSDHPDGTQEENLTKKLSVDPESVEDEETLPGYSGSSKDSGSRVTVWDNISTPKTPTDKTKLESPGCSTKGSTTKSSKKKKKRPHCEEKSSAALNMLNGGGDTSGISQTLDFQNRSTTDLDDNCDVKMEDGDNDSSVAGTQKEDKVHTPIIGGKKAKRKKARTPSGVAKT